MGLPDLGRRDDGGLAMANPQPINWDGGVSASDLWLGRKMRNEDRRTDAYETMAQAQATATEDSAKRKLLQEAADWTARAGMAVLQAPAADRPRLYAMALEEGRQRGYDLSRLPPQYDAATEGLIKFSVDRARPIADYFRRQRAPAGGGGGGYSLDAPYQPAAGAAPDAAPMPAPAAAPPAAPPVAPRPQMQPQAQPSTAGGAMPMDMGRQAPAPQQTAPGSVTVPLPPRPSPTPPQIAPQPGMAPPAPQIAAAPTPPPQDAGQDRGQGGGIPEPGPTHPSGFDLRDGDRIVRGRGGAARTVGGRIEVRDAKGQPAFRDPIKATPQERPPPTGFRWNADRTGHEPIPGGKYDTTVPKPPKERPLTETARKNLKELGDTAGAFVSLTGSFKDNYGGYGSSLLGDADLGFKARVQGDTSGADWWRLYQQQKNIVRNDLFGAALTKVEKGEFEKADVSSGLRADVIRRNLTTRTQIMLRGLSRVAASMQADGYGRDAIEAVVGMPLDALPPAVNDTPEMRATISKILGSRQPGDAAPAGGAPPAPGGAPKRLRFNPATQELE
jgi:hypothetical protein